MRVLTVRGAELVWDGVGAAVPGGEVVCAADGRVAAAGPAGRASGAVLDASGCVVPPGLVNAHHHLLQTAFRTLPGTRGVPMRDWLPTMAAAYRSVGVDPEATGIPARAGLAEALLSGVTTVADHHLTWPEGADAVGMARATAEAGEALGARLVF